MLSGKRRPKGQQCHGAVYQKGNTKTDRSVVFANAAELRSRAPKFNGCAFECPGRQLPARPAVRRQFSASSFRSPRVLHHQRLLLESRSRRQAVLREVGVEDGGFACAGNFLEPLTAKCQTPLTWCNIRTTMKSTFPWSQRRYLLIRLRSPVRWRTT